MDIYSIWFIPPKSNIHTTDQSNNPIIFEFTSSKNIENITFELFIITTVNYRVMSKENQKLCSGCNTIKTIDDFAKDKTSPSGYQGKCKKCKNSKSYFDDTLDPNVATKKCSSKSKGCDKTLTLVNFSKNKAGRLGYHNLCDECRKKERRDNLNTEPDIKGTKACNGHFCEGKILAKSEFHLDKYAGDGLQTLCRKCEKYKTAVSKSKFEPFITMILKDCRGRVRKKSEKRRNLAFEINLDFIIQLFHKQEGKCAITNMIMTHNALNEDKSDTEHIRNLKHISIDRIDSSIGYTKNNVHLVCAIINRMKYNLDASDFIIQCFKIYSYYKQIVHRPKLDLFTPQSSVSNVNEISQSNKFIKFAKYKKDCAFHNAKRQKKIIEIEPHDIINKYIEQKGICALSGEILEYEKHLPDALSVDKINPNGHYTKDNIQLTTVIGNKVRSDLNLEKLNILAEIVIRSTNKLFY